MKPLAAAMEGARRQVRGGIQSWVGHGLAFLVVAILLPGAVTAQAQPEVAPPETGGDTPQLTYQRVELQHLSLAAVGMIRTLRGTIWRVGPDGIVGYSRIAAGGTFQFPHVAPGQYLVRVEANAVSEASAAEPVTIRRDETTTVSLTLGETLAQVRRSQDTRSRGLVTDN